MTIKMKKQPSPQRSCRQPERTCKAIKKHSCSEHTKNRSYTDEGAKSKSIELAKKFCPCNPCACDICPDVLQLLNRPISNKGIGNKSMDFEDLSGLCPKFPDAKPASCSKTCTEAVRPQAIKLDMITYDEECTCELIARAIRADVHRYLSLVDRTPKPAPQACPECMAKSFPKPTPKSDFQACPECIAESIPNCNPKSKITFSDSDIDPKLLPCLQPETETDELIQL